MLGWFMLILFIILVLIVWISLVANAKHSKNYHHGQDKSLLGHEQGSEIQKQAEEIGLEFNTMNPAYTENSSADDLTIIEGIGPKVRAVLNQVGIYTFKQLGETENTLLRRILDNAKYPYMDPGTWPNQARLADEGKLEELNTFKEQLKAGRK